MHPSTLAENHDGDQASFARGAEDFTRVTEMSSTLPHSKSSVKTHGTVQEKSMDPLPSSDSMMYQRPPTRDEKMQPSRISGDDLREVAHPQQGPLTPKQYGQFLSPRNTMNGDPNSRGDLLKRQRSPPPLGFVQMSPSFPSKDAQEPQRPSTAMQNVVNPKKLNLAGVVRRPSYAGSNLDTDSRRMNSYRTDNNQLQMKLSGMLSRQATPSGMPEFFASSGRQSLQPPAITRMPTVKNKFTQQKTTAMLTPRPSVLTTTGKMMTPRRPSFAYPPPPPPLSLKPGKQAMPSRPFFPRSKSHIPRPSRVMTRPLPLRSKTSVRLFKSGPRLKATTRKDIVTPFEPSSVPPPASVFSSSSSSEVGGRRLSGKVDDEVIEMSEAELRDILDRSSTGSPSLTTEKSTSEEEEEIKTLDLRRDSGKQLDIWYPFKDKGTMYSAYFPPLRYSQLRYGTSPSCRHMPFASALNLQGALNSVSMRSRAFFPVNRVSGSTPVHIMASSPVFSPSIAYEYERFGESMMSSPPSFIKNQPKTELESSALRPIHTPRSRFSQRSNEPSVSIARNRESSLKSRRSIRRKSDKSILSLRRGTLGDSSAFGKHVWQKRQLKQLSNQSPEAPPSLESARDMKRIALMLKAETDQASTDLNRLQSGMLVQTHEMRVMAQAIKDLRDRLVSQEAEVRNARKRDLAGDTVYQQPGRVIGQNSFNQMLRQATEKSAHLKKAQSSKTTNAVLKNLQTAPVASNITPPILPHYEDQPSQLGKSQPELPQGSPQLLESKKRNARNSAYSNSSRSSSSSESSPRSNELSVDKKYSEKYKDRNDMRNLNTSLPPELQAVLVKPPIDKQSQNMFFIMEDSNIIANKLEVSDVRTMQIENCRLHKMLATLEQRLASVITELQARDETENAVQEILESLKVARQEKEDAERENLNLRAEVERSGMEMQALRRANTELIKQVEYLQARSTFSEDEGIPEIRIDSTHSPTRYTYSRTIRRGSSENEEKADRRHSKQQSKLETEGGPAVLRDDDSNQAKQPITLSPKTSPSPILQSSKMSDDMEDDLSLGNSSSIAKRSLKMSRTLSNSQQPSIHRPEVLLGQVILPKTYNLLQGVLINLNSLGLPEEARRVVGQPILEPKLQREVSVSVACRVLSEWQAKLASSGAQAQNRVAKMQREIDASNMINLGLERKLVAATEGRKSTDANYTAETQKQADFIEKLTSKLTTVSNELDILKPNAARANCIPMLEQKLAQLVAEKKNLEGKTELLKKQIEENAREFDSRMMDARKLCDTLIVERDRNAKELYEMNQRNSQLKSDLEKTGNLLTKAERTIIDLSPETRDAFMDIMHQRALSTDAQIIKLREQLQETSLQKSREETIRKNLKEDLEKVKQKLTSQEKLFEQVNDDLNEKAHILGEERAERLSRERLFKETQLRNEFVERCLTEHESTIREKNNKIQEILENREKFKEALKIVGENYKNLEIKNSENENLLNQEKELTKSLDDKIERMTILIQSLQQDFMDIEREKAELKTQLDRADLILIRRAADCDELSIRLDQKLNIIQELTEENTILKSNLDNLTFANDKLEKQNSITTEKISLNEKLKNFTEKNRNLVSKENENLKLDLETTSNELRNLQRNYEQSQISFKQTLATKATMESELDRLNKETHVLREQLRAKNIQTSMLEQRVSTMESTEKMLMKEAAQARQKQLEVTGKLHEFGSELTEALSKKDQVIDNLIKKKVECEMISDTALTPQKHAKSDDDKSEKSMHKVEKILEKMETLFDKANEKKQSTDTKIVKNVKENQIIPKDGDPFEEKLLSKSKSLKDDNIVSSENTDGRNLKKQFINGFDDQHLTETPNNISKTSTIIKKKLSTICEQTSPIPTITSQQRYKTPPVINQHQHETPPALTQHRYETPPVINQPGYEIPPALTQHRYETPPVINQPGYEIPPALTQHRYERPPVIYQHRYETPPALTQHRYETPPALTQHRYETPPALTQHRYETPPALTQHRYETSPALTQHRYEIPPVINQPLLETMPPTTYEMYRATVPQQLPTPQMTPFWTSYEMKQPQKLEKYINNEGESKTYEFNARIKFDNQLDEITTSSCCCNDNLCLCNQL